MTSLSILSTSSLGSNGSCPGPGNQPLNIQSSPVRIFKAADKFVAEELSLPASPVGCAPALDIVGLLSRAGNRALKSNAVSKSVIFHIL